MSKTCPQDIRENELERRWAQVLNDGTQPRPTWYPELIADVVEHHENADMLTLALDIIERFPPNADNDQVSAVIDGRLEEERLYSEPELIDWLYADKRRAQFLNSIIRSEEVPEDLCDALRRAWAECLRDVIATVRCFLDKCGEPVFEIVIEDGDL